MKDRQTYKITGLFTIEGKTALITGGSRGIGFMIAQAYVENGVTVYITSRTEDECQKAASTLSQSGHCIAIPGDISTESGRNALVDSLSQHIESLDILVNNAGILLSPNPKTGFEGYSDDAFGKVLDINVKAPYRLTQMLFGLLENNASQVNPAKVINIGSVYGLRVTKYDNAAAYGPSKAAVHCMTKEMAKYLARRGVVVNAIAPGLFESNMSKSASDEFMKQYTADCPVGRIGYPKDMAGIAVFLASSASNYINGEVITVDGGYIL